MTGYLMRPPGREPHPSRVLDVPMRDGRSGSAFVLGLFPHARKRRRSPSRRWSPSRRIWANRTHIARRMNVAEQFPDWGERASSQVQPTR